MMGFLELRLSLRTMTIQDILYQSQRVNLWKNIFLNVKTKKHVIMESEMPLKMVINNQKLLGILSD